MAYVLQNAKQGYDRRLALFNSPPVETAIQEIYYKDYKPVSQMTSGNTALEFEVQNSSSDYIMLQDICLMLTLQILNDKGKPISVDDNVGLVNFPACTIFRQQDFSLQQKILTSSIGSNFQYKAILDALLQYGKNDQLTWMSLGGFHKDDSGEGMDDNNASSSANGGLSSRYDTTAGGKKAVFRTKLFNDVCQQSRMLVNGVPINIKLYPTTDKERLMYPDRTGTTPPPSSFFKVKKTGKYETTDPDPGSPGVPEVQSKYYSLSIEDATLIVPYAKIHPCLLTKHAEVMKKEMALYPFTRSELKTYNIAAGSYNWTMDNIFQDSVPKRLILACVDSGAYAGNNEKNPFNFDNCSVNYVDFQVDGQSNGSQVLQPDYKSDNYVMAYSKLFESCPMHQKEPPNIMYDEFPVGYCIYVFDLEKSKDPGFSNPLRRGQTRLTLKFLTPNKKPITAIVYGSFESLFKVDSSRNVILET